MKPDLRFLDETRKTELEPPCRRALDGLELPSHSTICIFDNQERQLFSDDLELGQFYCGFFYPISRVGLQWRRWPQPILDLVWTTKGWAFDTVIYVRHRTCESTIGTVITFVHELTHLMQFGFHYKAWQAEKMVQTVCANEPRAPWLWPTEHEAQLCARKAAEAILGRDEVTAYASKQLAKEFDDTEPGLAQRVFYPKWEFFLGLNTEQSFNLTEEIDRLVRNCRRSLIARFPARNSTEPDFTKDNWWN